MSYLSEIPVGVCPECGEPVSVDDLNYEVQKLTLVAGTLIGTVTTMAILMHDSKYAAIAESWHEHLAELAEKVAKLVHDTQAFGEAFDGSQSED